jgi:membrane-bound metal-dependent hydrolase YbcI (DUF457 family)
MIHSLFGLFVVLPFLTGLRRSRKRALVWGAVLGGAVALDLDHFVAARSFRLRDAASLSSRPATHSLTFGALAGGLAALPSRQVVVAWMTFAVLASHVVRDAFSGQTPWLWPLSTRAIPQWSYYTLELLLFGISYFFRARGWRIAPLRDMITD